MKFLTLLLALASFCTAGAQAQVLYIPGGTSAIATTAVGVSGKIGIGPGANNPKAPLDIQTLIPGGALGAVFGRLSEGNTTGAGTFLGVRGWATQVSSTDYYGKSFSLEHSFYGSVNSSVNFFRGLSTTGGFLTFNVDKNTEAMRIEPSGKVLVATGALNPMQLELKTYMPTTGDYDQQKWSNTHRDDYYLKLQSQWTLNGITQRFIHAFGGTEHNSLTFYRDKVGMGTNLPQAFLEVKSTVDQQGSFDSQLWSNTHRADYNLKLQTYWDNDGISQRFVQNFGGTEYNSLWIYQGNVGIGTVNEPREKLVVGGNINSREVRVTVNAGADFVFDEAYELPALSEVETFVRENKHLPEIASAKEMQDNGLELGKMDIKLLQKVEELTLYLIELNRKVEKLEAENKKLIEQIKTK
jgi:hypothetical protein